MDAGPDVFQWLGITFIALVIAGGGSCAAHYDWSDWCSKGRPWAVGTKIYRCVESVK